MKYDYDFSMVLVNPKEAEKKQKEKLSKIYDVGFLNVEIEEAELENYISTYLSDNYDPDVMKVKAAFQQFRELKELYQRRYLSKGQFSNYVDALKKAIG